MSVNVFVAVAGAEEIQLTATKTAKTDEGRQHPEGRLMLYLLRCVVGLQVEEAIGPVNVVQRLRHHVSNQLQGSGPAGFCVLRA